MQARLITAGIGLLLVPMAGVVHAGPILFEHVGNTDPTTEGWAELSFNGLTVGPVTNDQGSGLDAWSVDDNGGQFGLYNQVPTTAQIAEAGADGWFLRSRHRVVNIPDANDFSIDVGYRNGTSIYSMAFGSTADGDPTVRLFGSSTNTLTGLGSGYHLYDLIFDAGVGSASLFVDGTLVESGYSGVSQSVVGVFFGSGQTGSSGHGHYSLVQFGTGAPAAVPEPSSVAVSLLALGLLMLHAYRRRKPNRATNGR